MPLKKSLRRLNTACTKLEKAQSTWDFADFLRYKKEFKGIIQEVIGGWESELFQLESDLFEKQRTLEEPKYRDKLESALRAKGLSLNGQFPDYSIGPFDLRVDTSTPVITFKFGRRAEKFRFFAPEEIAERISSRYRSIVNRPFNASFFAKDLRTVYEIANRLSYNDRTVQWDRVVSLKEIYKLLTLRRGSRREYPETHYIYDLSRFRKSEMHFDDHRFELGTSREVGRTYLLLDLDTGREIRVSSLTIYKEG